MDWTSFVESPKSGASHSRVLCLGCFLVLTQLLQPLNLLQLLIVPNDPKCGTAVAAMGGVPSKTNADEEDEYHDEVHDSKARWQVFSGEKKDVNKNDLSILGNSMWDLIWCLTVCNYQICMFWNVMFKFTSAEMIYHYDSLCCSSSRAMTSLNQDLSTICLNKSRKKTQQRKESSTIHQLFSVKDLWTENDEHFCQEFEAEHPENQEPIAVRVRLGHSHSGTLTVVTMARRKNPILRWKMSIEYYR